MKWTPVVFDRVQEANDRINNLLQKRFADAVNSDLNIVVDMTNMTASVRKNALKHADKKDYFKRAVVFTFQDSDLPELMRRMKERSDKIRKQGGSKTIGEDVVNRMIKSFEAIDPKEGFDRVDTINTFSV
jgi:transcriptional regulator of met regulon